MRNPVQNASLLESQAEEEHTLEESSPQCVTLGGQQTNDVTPVVFTDDGSCSTTGAASSVCKGAGSTPGAPIDQVASNMEQAQEPASMKRRVPFKENEKRVYVWASELGGTMGPWWVRTTMVGQDEDKRPTTFGRI